MASFKKQNRTGRVWGGGGVRAGKKMEHITSLGGENKRGREKKEGDKPPLERKKVAEEERGAVTAAETGQIGGISGTRVGKGVLEGSLVPVSYEKRKNRDQKGTSCVPGGEGAKKRMGSPFRTCSSKRGMRAGRLPAGRKGGRPKDQTHSLQWGHKAESNRPGLKR